MTDTDLAISDGMGGDTEIDLYADVVENELETETHAEYIAHNDRHSQETDLYDDVITAQPASNDFTDITNTVNQNHGKHDHPNESLSSGMSQSNTYNGKRFSLYIGQLTWWTTDVDLAVAIQDLGIKDLLEIKFHENRVNGQSKGFALVTVGSEVSSRTIMDKMPKSEIHGQNPMALPCTKQSLSFFEGPSRKDGHVDQTPPMGILPLRPMMRPPMGLPPPMLRSAPMESAYRFPPQGPVILPGGPGGMARAPMPMARGPLPGGQFVLGRMPGPPTPGVHPQQQVLVMQRPGLPPGTNGFTLIRNSIQPGTPGVPVSSSSMGVMPGQHTPNYYPGQPTQGPPQHGVSLAGQGPSDPNYRPVDPSSDPAVVGQISEQEFQQIMDRNKHVSSSAIAHAVQNASTGDFVSAIETLVTAIALIKQSRVANHDGCRILINSLQDALKGIKEKSYEQRGRHRSRSGSPREPSRKKHRHRSRSPRDRGEYRRSEDYDGKYGREHRRR